MVGSGNSAAEAAAAAAGAQRVLKGRSNMKAVKLEKIKKIKDQGISPGGKTNQAATNMQPIISQPQRTEFGQKF